MMNWVGGARSRVKIKRDKKKQQEFFERKRLNQSSNTSSAYGKHSTGISQDISWLQMITNFCNTSTSKGSVPKIHEVDLGSKNAAIFPVNSLSPTANICKSETGVVKEDDFLNESTFFYKPKNKNGNFLRKRENLFYSSLQGNKIKDGVVKKNLSRVQWASEDFQESPIVFKDGDKPNWNETKYFHKKNFDNEGPIFKPFKRNKFRDNEEFCCDVQSTTDDKYQSPFISTWLDQQKKQNINCQPLSSPGYKSTDAANSYLQIDMADAIKNSQEFEKEEILSSETEKISNSSFSPVDIDVDVEDLIFELVFYVSVITPTPEKTGIDFGCQFDDEKTRRNVSVQTSPMKWCSVCAHNKMFFNGY